MIPTPQVEGTPNGEVIKLADFGLASIIHLKGAVDAVIATKRMGSSRLMGLFASASETPTSGAATEATPAAEAPAAATTA